MWPYNMSMQDVDAFLEEHEWLLRTFLETGYHNTIQDFLNDYDAELCDWLVCERGRDDLE